MEDSFLKLLVAINGGTLVAIITFGYKVVKFINIIQFKTDIMWNDYESRVHRAIGDYSRIGDYHREDE